MSNIADHLLDGELDQLEVRWLGKVREMLAQAWSLEYRQRPQHGRNG